MDDKKETAEATIIFINFIINKIDNSILTFTTDNFLDKVFDPDFVKKAEYGSELFNEIPKKRLLEVLIEIYRRRLKGNKENLKLVTDRIFSGLNERDSELFLKMISDEMQTEKEENTISSTIYLLPPEFWPRLKKTARMRIENKLINSINEGKVDIYTGKLVNGAFGTWAIEIAKYFILRKEITSAIYSKIVNGEDYSAFYALKYFTAEIPNFYFEKYEISACVTSVLRLIATNNDLVNYIVTVFRLGSSDWKEEIKSQFGKYTDEKDPLTYLPDVTPILKSGFNVNDLIQEQEDDGGDIPF